ncbi:hypothetical protein [Amaricoccus sp.]|uniref:hypothetical protein n=1 Tax=Amaricoccus sp. TaxID=1872485 RepID=UPI002614C5EF|nr:hypothetical protein [uncultured Amaricoccus sp.]
MTISETSADDLRARDTRRLWLGIVAAVLFWALTILVFGYPAVIVGALGLTALVYVMLLLLMRGK